MKNISTALKNHLAGEYTTMATCWLLTRLDGVQQGFTDASTDLLINGITYRASTGFTPTAITTSNDFSVDNLDVQGMLDSPDIAAADLEGGKYDYATLQIFQVNYIDLTMGQLNIREGFLGQVTLKRGQFVVEVRGMMQSLQQTIGRLYGASCDADLGDSRCKVNLASVTYNGTVQSVTNTQQFTDAASGKPNGYFTYGLLTWASGLNKNLKMEVKTFDGTNFVLFQAMPYLIQVGDTYSVYAGCDKSLPTCVNKFNNINNFRGFPYVPGQDKLVQYGSNS